MIVLFDIPLIIVLTFLVGGVSGVLTNDPQLFVLGMFGLAFGTLFGAVKVGHKLGLMNRHKIESPFLFIKLVVASSALLFGGCIFHVLLFTDILVAGMKARGFPVLAWDYWLLVSSAHLLLILGGVSRGLINQKPGLSPYELQR